MWEQLALIVALCVFVFFQNMSFTWTSRSRNSGNPSTHRKAALLSNGIWFASNVLFLKTLWPRIEAGEWYWVILAGLAYTISTTEGSVFMMKRLLKSEKGKDRVGAR